jgi:hypothetical protein
MNLRRRKTLLQLKCSKKFCFTFAGFPTISVVIERGNEVGEEGHNQGVGVGGEVTGPVPPLP